MRNYATLRELEKTALDYPDDLLGEDLTMDITATKIEKLLHPLHDLNRRIARATGNYRAPFELRSVPSLWLYLVGLYIDEEAENWFNDKKVFGGSRYGSPKMRLSRLEPIPLRAHVDEIAELFYDLYTSATFPPFPSQEQLYYVTRLAQAEQLEKKK